MAPGKGLSKTALYFSVQYFVSGLWVISKCSSLFRKAIWSEPSESPVLHKNRSGAGESLRAPVVSLPRYPWRRGSAAALSGSVEGQRPGSVRRYCWQVLLWSGREKWWEQNTVLHHLHHHHRVLVDVIIATIIVTVVVIIVVVVIVITVVIVIVKRLVMHLFIHI